MTLTHADIARRVPHAGSMCLLHEVLDWNEHQIQARATNHRDPHHPLRSAQGLGVSCGIEYAAQTMAVHGSLLSGGNQPRSGRLASVRAVQCHVRWLDRTQEDLTVSAQRISGDDAGMAYEFQIHAAEHLLLRGRASLVLIAAGLTTP